MKMRKSLLFMAVICGTLLFVLFGEGCIGYVMGGDTEAYYLNFHHHIGVAPGYPLFIHIIELIFGSERYLYIVVALQIILLVSAVVYLIYILWMLFSLKDWELVIIWAFTMLPFVLLLPEDPIGHTLMTESLTYPIFYIFMAVILRGVVERRESCFAYGLFWSMLMTLIRPQMQFSFAVLGIAYFYVVVQKRLCYGKGKNVLKSWCGKAILCILTILLCMKVVSGLTVVYEKVFFDAPALDYSDQTLVQRLLYVADEEDEQLFERQDIREIYRVVWQRMQKMGTTQNYYDHDWKSWSSIFQAFGANSRILGDVIREKLSNEGTLSVDAVGQEIQVSEISHELTVTLMKEHWKEHLRLTIQLLPKSFISTVLFHKEGIYPLILAITGVVYLFALIGSLVIFIKGREQRVAEWMLMVIMASSVNALGCDLILCGLQRYMCYTLGMTWSGVYLLGRALLQCGKAAKSVAFIYD